MVKVYEDLFPIGFCGNRKPGMYMNEDLVVNWELIRKAVVNDDWDCVICIDGVEGSGKSVLALQQAFFFDPTFNLERVAFTPEEFVKCVEKAGKNQAIVYDEALQGLSSRRSMSQTNYTLVSMLAEIRQKNLFVFIVLPTFFDLDRNVALWRTRALLHVYTDGFARGYFKFFNHLKKKQLYVNGKKWYNYNMEKPNFIGNFTNFYPIDKEEYKKKKFDSLGRYKKDMPKGKYILKQEILMHPCKAMHQKGMTMDEIAEIMNIHSQTVSKYIKMGTKDDLG